MNILHLYTMLFKSGNIILPTLHESHFLVLSTYLTRSNMNIISVTQSRTRIIENIALIQFHSHSVKISCILLDTWLMQFKIWTFLRDYLKYDKTKVFSTTRMIQVTSSLHKEKQKHIWGVIRIQLVQFSMHQNSILFTICLILLNQYY